MIFNVLLISKISIQRVSLSSSRSHSPSSAIIAQASGIKFVALTPSNDAVSDLNRRRFGDPQCRHSPFNSRTFHALRLVRTDLEN